MVDLGIIAWGESPRMFAEYVLALIKKPIHLLRLKLIFDAAEKIGEGERFQVVRKPSSDLIEYYRSKLQKCTRPELAELAEQLEIPEEALGKVLVISEEVSGTSTRSRQQLTKFMPVPLKVAVFDGLYAAKRSISHALAGYALERELLASAAASIDQIADKLENDWKTKTDADVKSCLQRELQGVAETYAPKFEGASNIFKIEIYDSLCNIIKSSAESQGSINPRACANMLRAISRRLNARANEAIGKESFRAEDGGAIDLLIKAWEGTFEVLEGELQKKINFFNNNYSLFNDHSNCSRIRQHLITSLDSLHKMTARPFLSFASAIIETDQELQSAINELNHGQVRRLLAKMDVIIRLQRVQRGFEQLIADTSNRKGLSEEQLQKSIDTLLTSLPAQTSLVKPIYRELYPRYESLAEHVRKVVIELRSHRVDPRNLQERQAHIQAIRELATEHFDLEQELKLVVAKSSEESAKTDR
jgi:hypothetical protein